MKKFIGMLLTLALLLSLCVPALGEAETEEDTAISACRPRADIRRECLR